VVKKPKFTKRTQMENHKMLSLSWMRKNRLASFSKTNPFRSFKAIQRLSKRFKAFGEKNSFPKSLVPLVSLWLKTGPLGQLPKDSLLSFLFQAMMLMHY
jgi:hypothetical protein